MKFEFSERNVMSYVAENHDFKTGDFLSEDLLTEYLSLLMNRFRMPVRKRGESGLLLMKLNLTIFGQHSFI